MYKEFVEEELKKKGMTPEKLMKQLVGNLTREMDHWKYVYEHGCQDPFWPDGTNLNLTVNHIIYDKKMILALCEIKALSIPEECMNPTPPVVDNGYMVKDNPCYQVRKKRISENGMTITHKKVKKKTYQQASFL